MCQYTQYDLSKDTLLLSIRIKMVPVLKLYSDVIVTTVDFMVHHFFDVTRTTQYLWCPSTDWAEILSALALILILLAHKIGAKSVVFSPFLRNYPTDLA